MTFGQYVTQQVGPNWVVHARRTNRLIEKYGEDVRVITPKRMESLHNEYNAAHPCRCGRRSHCCGTCEQKSA